MVQLELAPVEGSGAGCSTCRSVPEDEETGAGKNPRRKSASPSTSILTQQAAKVPEPSRIVPTRLGGIQASGPQDKSQLGFRLQGAASEQVRAGGLDRFPESSRLRRAGNTQRGGHFWKVASGAPGPRVYFRGAVLEAAAARVLLRVSQGCG